MTAGGQPKRLVDHERGLTDVSSVIGRGTDSMTPDEVAALYPVTFEDALMAGLDEQGEVPL